MSVHAAVCSLFNLGRYLISAENYRYFGARSFGAWGKGSGDIEEAKLWILLILRANLSIPFLTTPK